MQVQNLSHCAKLASRRRMVWVKRNDSTIVCRWLGCLMNLRRPRLRLSNHPLELSQVKKILWQPPWSPTRPVAAKVVKLNESNNILPTSRCRTWHRILLTRQQAMARTSTTVATVMCALLFFLSAKGANPQSRLFHRVHSHSYRHRTCNSRVVTTSWHQSTRLSLSPLARASKRPNFTSIRWIELRTKVTSLRWILVA